MSRNLRNDSKERVDDLKTRINALAVRVNLALNKYLKKPLPENLQDPRPAALRRTPPPPPSRAPPPPPPPPSRTALPPPSRTALPPPSRTAPPPLARVTTTLSRILYPPFSPPPYPPPNIPLPPLPLSAPSIMEEPSLHFPKPPSHKRPRKPSGTARCVEAGNLAADAIDAVPPGFRRLALIAFDRRHPLQDRIEARPSLPGQVVRGTRTAPIRNNRRRGNRLPVVPEE